MPVYHFNEGQLTLPASGRDCTTHIVRLPDLQAVLTISRDLLAKSITLEDYVAEQIDKIKRDARDVQILALQFTEMHEGKRICQFHCEARIAGQVHYQQQHIIQTGQALLALAWTLNHSFTEQDCLSWQNIVDSFTPREISVE